MPHVDDALPPPTKRSSDRTGLSWPEYLRRLPYDDDTIPQRCVLMPDALTGSYVPSRPCPWCRIGVSAHVWIGYW
jgi:hypothetical protein